MVDQDLIQWLLEAQTPSIRYLTRIHLLGQDDEDIEVQATRAAMKTVGPIPAILSNQTKTGTWRGERSYYTPKYTSTHWSMLLLAELAAEPDDSRVRRGAIYMLGETWEGLQRDQEMESHGWSCFWANLLRYALHAELDDDPRVPAVVELLVHDGVRAEWRCEHNHERPCAWGAARAIWALAGLPERMRTPEVEAAIENGITFLLDEHSLLKGDYPAPIDGKKSPLWSKLNFPLFYQVDKLLVLRALMELDRLDHPGAEESLAWLERLRMKNGRWRGSNPYKSRTWGVMGDSQETGRWVSLFAALVLEQAQGI